PILPGSLGWMPVCQRVSNKLQFLGERKSHHSILIHFPQMSDSTGSSRDGCRRWQPDFPRQFEQLPKMGFSSKLDSVVRSQKRGANAERRVKQIRTSDGDGVIAA